MKIIPFQPCHGRDLPVLWIVSFGVKFLALPSFSLGAETIPVAGGTCLVLLNSGSAAGNPPPRRMELAQPWGWQCHRQCDRQAELGAAGCVS